MSEYAINIRRELHMYPEICFELPKTLEIIRRELTELGIPFTEKYGKSCIVATINEDKSDFTIGIRADIDALPITERTELAYKSKIDGQMHACGHDGHTAVLLDTARKLVAMKDKISCRVMLLFQSAEEDISGAKTMVEDGIMDELDCIVALHVTPDFKVGTVALREGPINAVTHGFKLDFYGKSAHPASQQDGIDAIAMAVKAYTAIELAVAREIAPTVPFIFNCGAFNGGIAKNAVCDHVELKCTMRSWDDATERKMVGRIKAIIESVAAESGGRAAFTSTMRYPIVNNDANITERLRRSAAKVVGETSIGRSNRSLGGEDFAFYADKKPGCMMHLGVGNPEKNCVYSLHQDKFNLDEDALGIGSDIFVRFVLDNMIGIDD